MLDNDPLWYKDAIIYEVHVRAFHDSNGDGVGDFRGLAQKLDYLEDLGVNAIWLLPFYPSPLKDDGYDIADYTQVHPPYGALTDFKQFLDEAHQRGIRVVTEMVLNHTSDQHPWFQRARRAPPGSAERDFYVWSDDPARYKGTRIIFKDFEPSNWTFDHVAGAYYWHRFYSHQPDLNYDNPQVHKAILPIVDFWLGMGVDGMRLDAVPYLYEREGTTSENLSETHSFLKNLRRHADTNYPGRMFLAEANQWPEDAAAYFGRGDECHMAFHFPLMPRLFMALRMEDRFPILDVLAQTPAIPDNCQWALFLRNHDELTLEMVTEEERCFMCRVYASDPQARVNLGIRRRLAPLLNNDRRRIELLNGLLFSLPGTPVIYYGDEIGMGDNIYLGDRNGVRTPMQWNADQNAGFSRANPQRLYLPIIIDPEYHYQAVNVQAHEHNPRSLLWWMRRLVQLRKRFRALSRGKLEFLDPANQKVLAFLRRLPGHANEETILVVANLSRSVQHAELDLTQFAGQVPIEMFGRTELPPVGDVPYPMMLGPYAFYWLALERPAVGASRVPGPEVNEGLPLLSVWGGWPRLFRGGCKSALEGALPGYLQRRPWFQGRMRAIVSVELQDAVPLPSGGPQGYLTVIRIEYAEGEPETYVLPLALAPDEQVLDRFMDGRDAAVARLHGATEGVLYDAVLDPAFCEAMLASLGRGNSLSGRGEVRAWSDERAFAGRKGEHDLTPRLRRPEKRNRIVTYGDRLVLKFYPRVEEGINPDLEIGRFLTRQRFSRVPPVLGALEYFHTEGEPMTLAVLEGYVPHEQDAWQYSLHCLERYFQRASGRQVPEMALSASALLTLAKQEPTPLARELLGDYLKWAALLGARTAELHLALASAPEDPSFAPEPFSRLYRRSLYQSLRGLAGQALRLLAKHQKHLSGPLRRDAQAVLDRRDAILSRFRAVLESDAQGARIQCHGDYRLAQILCAAGDVVIIDFEGQPDHSLGERRLKCSPLLDAASMVRSFHHAADTALLGRSADAEEPGDPPTGKLRPVVTPKPPVTEKAAHFWCAWASAAFLREYLSGCAAADLLPPGSEDLRMLFDAYLLQKAMRDLLEGLTRRPDGIQRPLRGLLQLQEEAQNRPG